MNIKASNLEMYYLQLMYKHSSVYLIVWKLVIFLVEDEQITLSNLIQDTSMLSILYGFIYVFVVNFILDYTAGALTQHLSSAARSSSCEGNTSDDICISEVTTDSFAAVVMNPAKVILIRFFHHCVPFCKQVPLPRICGGGEFTLKQKTQIP